jgi:hypothetical protein
MFLLLLLNITVVELFIADRHAPGSPVLTDRNNSIVKNNSNYVRFVVLFYFLILTVII